MTSAATGPSGTISLPGRGVVAVDPDVAVLRLGVVIIRPTAAAARSTAAATMQAVLGALADGGVERRDLRTTLVGLGDPGAISGRPRSPEAAGRRRFRWRTARPPRPRRTS